MESENVEIYVRPVDWDSDGIPEGPPRHTIFRDWNGEYHEHSVTAQKTIKILHGSLDKLSPATQWYFAHRHPVSRKVVCVNKKNFFEAMHAFTSRHDGKNYHVLNFSTNCIGFKRYVLKRSLLG